MSGARGPRAFILWMGGLGLEAPADTILYTVVLEMDLSDVLSHFGAFK